MKRQLTLLIISLVCTQCAMAQPKMDENIRDPYIYTSKPITIDGVLFSINHYYNDYDQKTNTITNEHMIFDQSVLIKYPCNKEGDTYIIPNGTYYIANGAFKGCKYLKKLVIPVSVGFIGEKAFEDCSIEEFEIATKANNYTATTIIAPAKERDPNATEVARFDVNGMMINGHAKGINIILYSDGTTEKVLEQ